MTTLSAAALHSNGLRLSTAFAANEGALLAVVALSAALVEPRTAALANALLYLFFALGCLASPAAVRHLGDRRSLVLGTSAYTLYVAAYIFPSRAGVPVAASLAGACGAVLWTAQGHYFARNARLHAAAVAAEAGSVAGAAEVSQAVSRFASIFAVAFPLALACFKALSALLIAGFKSPSLVYTVLAASALASVWHMSGVADLSETEGPADESESPQSVAQAATEVVRAHLSEPTLLLMLPTNLAFGMCSAFFPFAITLLAKDSLGEAAVGWLYSLSNLIAAATAFACGEHCRLNGPDGRRRCVAVGAACFFFCTSAVWLRSGDKGGWGVRSLSLLFCLYGVGVSVWQGRIMAFFGEAFPGHSSLAAFSSLKLQSGLASALCFFILPSANRSSAAFACAAMALLGFCFYLPAERRLQKRLCGERGECELAGLGEETGLPGVEPTKDEVNNEEMRT
jgi:hypothetical protein